MKHCFPLLLDCREEHLADSGEWVVRQLDEQQSEYTPNDTEDQIVRLLGVLTSAILLIAATR